MADGKHGAAVTASELTTGVQIHDPEKPRTDKQQPLSAHQAGLSYDGAQMQTMINWLHLFDSEIFILHDVMFDVPGYLATDSDSD